VSAGTVLRHCGIAALRHCDASRRVDRDRSASGRGRRSIVLKHWADVYRSAWADYFEKEGVAYAFFSAADAAAAQEQADKQRRRIG
jgi:hypothetical protein